MMKKKEYQKLVYALIAIIVLLGSLTTATFAWYIYNTNAHTTSVKMVAGSNPSLLIANTVDGDYKTSIPLASFTGKLVPVSTDIIVDNNNKTLFQKVVEWDKAEPSNPLAKIFSSNVVDSEFYKAELFIKTSSTQAIDVYLSDLSFDDTDQKSKDIATAIRVGFVVHYNGKSEYVFAISDEENPMRKYNTYNEHDNYNGENFVLDSSKTDGTVKELALYDNSMFCIYDENNNNVTLKPGSIPVATISANSTSGYNDRVQVDVYIWLEGCDPDCMVNLSGYTLKDVAVSFAGMVNE